MADGETRLYPIDTRNLEPGMTRAFEIQGISLLVCNVGGDLFALENRCSHAGARFDAGRLREHRLECPLHGALFDVRSGKPLQAPARRNVRVFPVEADRDAVRVALPQGQGDPP